VTFVPVTSREYLRDIEVLLARARERFCQCVKLRLYVKDASGIDPEDAIYASI